MPKLRFTTDSIKRLKPPIDKSKEQYFDTDLTGFMIEVKNTGSKTYYYRYRVNTSQKMIRIGNTNEISLDDAKKRYYSFLDNIALNKLPAQTINNNSNQVESQINSITFQEFYDNHYLPYIKAHIKSYETNISVFKNHILKDLTRIMQ